MTTKTRYDVSALVAKHGTTTVAERMGCSRRTVQRWVHNGVDAFLADEIAVKVANDHPAFIWGRDWT